MYRGLIHFHSYYSYDSILSMKQIINFALKNDLNFLVLTDHDTINGSLELKEYVKKNKIELEIIIAAEYKTEYGDVIALDIDFEITDMNFDNFVLEVKKQNGLILFPHPYVGHINIDKIAKYSDLIEIFNSRIDDINNHKAAELAKKYNKFVYFASDAHTEMSLKNSIIEFEKCASFKESLLKSKVNQITNYKNYNFEIIYSQLIKSVKHRNFRLFYSVMKRIIKQLITVRLFKVI